MEMGTSQRVVEYFVVQKITKLRVSHYFQNPQVENLFAFGLQNQKSISKSAYQLRTKDAYTVLGCPVPLKAASLE